MNDLRKFNNNHNHTYIAPLHKVPDGAKFYHVREKVHGVKVCNAYQRVGYKEVIFSRNDLVEVFKR